jgi:hypothetical protein
VRGAFLKAELSDCGLEVKKDSAKLEPEIRTVRPKPEPIVQPAADVSLKSVPKADPIARKSSNRNNPLPPNAVSSPSTPASVEISPPPKQPKSYVMLSSKVKRKTFKKSNSLSLFDLYLFGSPF